MKRFHFVRNFVIALFFLHAALVECIRRAKKNYTPRYGQAGKDVVWVPAPQELVDTMLDMAKVTSSDFVVDLGSGDGRIVIAAAKRGATALGVEYKRVLHKEC